MVLLAGVAGYLALTVLVWLVQDRLMFYPQALAAPASPPAGWRLEDVVVTTRDGTAIAGVLVLPPLARPALVIYLGGNAEEITSLASGAADTYGNRAVLLVNYRGYGSSHGKPGEKALVEDAVALYDWAAKRPDIDAARVALHGRSLGTGVAVQLAAERPVGCVVLTSPFASAREVAARMYWWLPVGMLLRHPFDSARRAPTLAMPALFLMGETDTLIPPRYSQRLADLWGGPVERRIFPGRGHDDIQADPGYAPAIREFLDRCA